MTQDQLREIVRKRANQRVSQKIADFQNTVRHAAVMLCPQLGAHVNWAVSDVGKQVLSAMQDSKNKGWPKRFWEDEEKAVMAEILQIMDELQKAMLAPEPKDGDPQPNEL